LRWRKRYSGVGVVIDGQVNLTVRRAPPEGPDGSPGGPGSPGIEERPDGPGAVRRGHGSPGGPGAATRCKDRPGKGALRAKGQGGTFALAQKILWRRGCDRRAG